MNFEAILLSWRGGLIVSCQADLGSPLARPEIIAAMAQVAEAQGAAGVRINGSNNVKAVKEATKLPILGIEKQVSPVSEVYITPTFDAAQRIAGGGADIIALDATERPRPAGESLKQLVAKLKAELNIPLMADVATFTQGVIAVEELGFELVSTTLSGYTKETLHNGHADFQLVEQLAGRLAVPVICEGRLRSPEDVTRAFNCGAYTVVVGAAITGIDWLVRKYVAATPQGWVKCQQ